jgi:hypothetical protein
MGQGGFIVLVNGTPYQWRQTYHHSYQMNSWGFPPTISPGSAVPVYVEWDQNITAHEKDDGGEVNYTLEGTNNFFQLQARGSPGFTLKVFLQGIATQNNVQGSTLNLGWVHDGSVNFILSGQAGNFSSSNPPVAWMQSNIHTLGNRPLRHICVPGSHDAGMSRKTGGTAGAFDCNVLTQSLSIGGQLNIGSRYFDIRPVISGGHYSAGHYSKVGKSWQGGNGEAIQDIINEINAFTVNNHELIVLNLSHDMNTDVGNESYRPFTPAEWTGLLNQMKGIRNLFVAPNATTVDLTTLPLVQFIGNNQAAVIVVVESDITLGDFANAGFYRYAQFNAYNAYSGTNDKNTMSNDQIQKMRSNRTSPDSQYFILSWTLTQDATEAATCFLGTASSIIALASQANPQLYMKVLPACSKQTYPNVLYIDSLNQSDVTALAMAINNFVNGS